MYQCCFSFRWTQYGIASQVTAKSNRYRNSIILTAGILQDIFFDDERPQYLNFGAIGYVIGHEITHNFDNGARWFDARGRNRNWWDQETEDQFIKRKQCVIEQYGNFTISELGLRVSLLNKSLMYLQVHLFSHPLYLLIPLIAGQWREG